MNCPFCQNVIPDNSAQCPACGKLLYTQAPQQPQNPYMNAQGQAYNPYANGAAQPYNGYNPASGIINEFAKKAKSLKTSGIIATVLMFGIGIFFSISIWVSRLQIPQVTPSNQIEAQMLEKAIKDYNLAKKLSFVPVIALVLCFIIGFIGGLAG